MNERTRGRRCESETRIVGGMSHDDHDPLIPGAQPFQATADECPAHTLALHLGKHRDRRQGDSRDGSVRALDEHPAEEDVSDQPLTHQRHQRNEDRALRAQPLDQVRFFWPAKCGFGDGSNRLAIYL